MEYYFCKQLQVQDFVQYTGYIISSIVIKTHKILNIFQIKFTSNSIVCVFSNMATGSSKTLQHLQSSASVQSQRLQN